MLPSHHLSSLSAVAKLPFQLQCCPDYAVVCILQSFNLLLYCRVLRLRRKHGFKLVGQRSQAPAYFVRGDGRGETDEKEIGECANVVVIGDSSNEAVDDRGQRKPGRRWELEKGIEGFVTALNARVSHPQSEDRKKTYLPEIQTVINIHLERTIGDHSDELGFDVRVSHDSWKESVQLWKD